MMDAKTLKTIVTKIAELDEKLNEIPEDDLSDEADQKFDAICAERDPLIDEAVRMLHTIGIDERTARHMVMNVKRRAEVIALCNRAC